MKVAPTTVDSCACSQTKLPVRVFDDAHPELLKQILFEMSMIVSLVFSDREVVHVSQSAPLVVKKSYRGALLD